MTRWLLGSPPPRGRTPLVQRPGQDGCWLTGGHLQYRLVVVILTQWCRQAPITAAGVEQPGHRSWNPDTVYGSAISRAGYRHATTPPFGSNVRHAGENRTRAARWVRSCSPVRYRAAGRQCFGGGRLAVLAGWWPLHRECCCCSARPTPRSGPRRCSTLRKATEVVLVTRRSRAPRCLVPQRWCLPWRTAGPRVSRSSSSWGLDLDAAAA